MVYKELELLIKQNLINVDNNFYIIDNNNKIYKFEGSKKDFEFIDIKDTRYGIHLYYSEEELATTINVSPFNINEYQPKYKEELIEMLERHYFNLDLAISNSQGCMDDITYYFDELKHYENVIEQLGGNLERDREKIYKQISEANKNQEELKVKRVPMEKFLFEPGKVKDDDLKSLLIHIVLKLNELDM